MQAREHREDPEPENSIIQEATRLRYVPYRQFAGGQRVLEVPCGEGRGASSLQDAARWVGMDADQEMIAYGPTLCPSAGFVAGAIAALPFRDACFDLVLSIEGLEQLFRNDVAAFLADAARVLVAGGKFGATVTLLRDGKHSGDPSHLFEYTEPNIRALLGRYFDMIEASVQDSGGSATLSFVGEKRSVPLAEPGPVEPEMQAPSRLLESAQADGPKTVLDACIAVLLAHGSGELCRLMPADRARLADLILSSQQSDGSFAGAGPSGPGYEAEQHTHFAIRALGALGVKPRRTMDWLQRLSDPGAIERWLNALDWTDIQRASERVTFVLDALVYRTEQERRRECGGVVHRALDWLERKQDPATGLWGVERSPAALVATARLVALFERTWRPVRNSVAIIDSTLALQQPDALFGQGQHGGADQDLAGAALLATMSKYTRHRSADLRRALVRAYWAIWNGGPHDRGDTSSALAQTLALGVIGAALPGDVPPSPCASLSWPGLGYFRPNDAARAPGPHDVRVWLRGGSVDPGRRTAPITVVITCYNLGLYLHEAIASVLEQTVGPQRIVVVDDGSTDDFTNLLLNNWPYAGVELVRQRNAGVSAARNTAIRSAATEFVCSMDADDRLHPEYFEKAVARISANDRLGYVSCYYRLFDCGSGTYRYNNTRLPEMLARNETCGISVFRKKAWEAAGGYCETLTTGLEDWDLWIGMLQAGYEGDVVPEVLFDYRIRPGSRNREAVKPANYERGCRLMAERRPRVYERFAIDVFALNARQFMELAGLRERELENAGRTADRLNVQLAAEQKSARALDEARKWLENQVEQWKRAADELQADLAASQAELARARQARLGPVGRAFRTAALFAGRSALSRAKNVLLWVKLRRDPERLRMWNELFDAEWYAKTYPDVAASGISVALHYVAVGHLEGRKPSPRFEPDENRSPSGVNPLVHSILYGEHRRSR